MVAIQKPSSHAKATFLLVRGGLIIPIILLIAFLSCDPDSNLLRKQADATLTKPQMVSIVAADEPPKPGEKLSHRPQQCPYKSLLDLTMEELHPDIGPRHMVAPPKGGKLTLVCCLTTVGPLNIAVHDKWAPRGAARFLEMVETKYFDSTVPLMRCIKNFLCQFGISADPDLTRKYRASIEDDPNWLPEGPEFRQNEQGVERFARGYMAYAGAGPNTRGEQFIVSLTDVGPLAGGSPWEVPWGELVGKHSFETLGKIYTGYGEDGPSQGYLGHKGVTDEVREKYPKLDYINSCEIVDDVIQQVW